MKKQKIIITSIIMIIFLITYIICFSKITMEAVFIDLLIAVFTILSLTISDEQLEKHSNEI
ncbi:MAG: hypothetical protein Q8900_03195 [Bacillota bacterium]|nr:hypothetical protein [Bacillota bacterium]